MSVVAPGDYGKPRPALVLQSDDFHTLDSVTVALLTSLQVSSKQLLRKTIAPTSGNGLRETSDVMIDKIITVPRTKVGGTVGNLTESQMTEITAALALFLGM